MGIIFYVAEVVTKGSMEMSVSDRLRYAREKANLTLTDVKNSTAIGESSLSDFENGKREPKLSQLQLLANLYHRSLSFLLSDAETANEVVLWRKRPAEGAEEIEGRFLMLCEQYHNLEVWNNSVTRPVLPEVDGDVERFGYNDAQELAYNVRNLLGLGSRPSFELLRVLEEYCGIKVFHERFEPTGTAASTRHVDFGAAILLNSGNYRWRRNYDLAHELFHLLTWRLFRTGNGNTSTIASDWEEKLANCFASNLLMPSESVSTVLGRYEQDGKIPIEAFFDVARLFDVSVEAVLWRWHILSNKGKDRISETENEIEQAKALSRIFEQRTSTDPLELPDRYRALAVESLARGEMSVGRFAEYLGISRRKAMDYLEQEAGKIEEAEPALA